MPSTDRSRAMTRGVVMVIPSGKAFPEPLWQVGHFLEPCHAVSVDPPEYLTGAKRLEASNSRALSSAERSSSASVERTLVRRHGMSHVANMLEGHETSTQCEGSDLSPGPPGLA